MANVTRILPGRLPRIALAAGLGLLLAACSAATATPAVVPTEATAANTGLAVPGQMRLALADTGNTARFLVTEQLAGKDLPSDAVGETTSIEGELVITEQGEIVAEASHFTVDLATLKTDSGMRDNFIRRNTLETSQYPDATFVPAAVSGLPVPLPTSGDVTFQLTGDMTLHGVTKSITWDVTGTIQGGNALVGQAATSFTFADFGLEQPRVARVLSVEDNIRLQYDFNLVLAQ